VYVGLSILAVLARAPVRRLLRRQPGPTWVAG
jgi:hypothetical protein